ncbi:MAG: HAD-IC family P-type ATPase [Polyangiaceae bacterium]
MGSEGYTIRVGLSARVAGREVLVGSARLLAGRGIAIPAEERALAEQAPGTSRLFVAVDGRFEGSLEYADEIRGETPGVIGALRAGDRREIVLLSGDAAGAVREVAGRVGIDRAIGGLLPEEKVHRVREMQAGGRTVAMVGDGINDAPALALSEVGISLDGATDVALEVADVVLLSGGLSNLPRAFDAADQAMARVQRGVASSSPPTWRRCSSARSGSCRRGWLRS